MKASFAFLLAAALLAAAVVVVNAGWTTYCSDGSCPNTITDVTPVKTKYGYGACIAGGYSSIHDEDHTLGIWCSPKGDFSDIARLRHFNSSLMEVAIASSVDLNSVVTSGVGIANNTHIMYSNDLENAYNSKVSLGAYGQDIKAIQSVYQRPANAQLFSAVGTMDILWGGRGLFLSEDSGKTFFNKTWDPTITYGDARYNHGFSTQTGATIYVSGGTWPAASSPDQEYSDLLNRCIRLSHHLCQPTPSTMSLAAIQEANRVVYSQSKRDHMKQSPNGGWIGLITVTHDAGDSWEKIFETDEFYFNDIHCANVNNCVAVGENSTNGYIYETKDGKNWTQRLHIESTVLVSMFRVRAVGTNGLWYATGGWYSDERDVIEGLIYKSTDDGITWQLDYTVPEVAIIMGLNFSPDGKVGYAVGSTQSQLAIVSKYEP